MKSIWLDDNHFLKQIHYLYFLFGMQYIKHHFYFFFFRCLGFNLGPYELGKRSTAELFFLNPLFLPKSGLKFEILLSQSPDYLRIETLLCLGS